MSNLMKLTTDLAIIKHIILLYIKRLDFYINYPLFSAKDTHTATLLQRNYLYQLSANVWDTRSNHFQI